MKGVMTLRMHARTEAQMPLRKYVLVVGGALLVLLFATDWVFPRPQSEHQKSEVRLPPIRIHSDRKGPEAVVFDTAQTVFIAPVEPDSAVSPVASADSAATEEGLPGSVQEPVDPAQLNEPKFHPRKTSIGNQARATHRPHAALSAPGHTIFTTPEGRMREAFAQARPPSHTSHGIRAATQD